LAIADACPYQTLWETDLDYRGRETYKSKLVYWRQHITSNKMTGCIGNRRALEALIEHDRNVSVIFGKMTALPILPPRPTG